MGERPVADCIQKAREAGYDVLQSNGDLTAAEVRLLEAPLREKRLSIALEPVVDTYDYVLIDCPPSLSAVLTLNALVAADAMQMPLQTEYYALEGLSALLATVKQIKITAIRASRWRASCARCTTRATTSTARSRRS